MTPVSRRTRRGSLRSGPLSLPLPPPLRAALAVADLAREGLLSDELTGRERVARAAVLGRLAADGVSMDELREAVGDDRLGMLLLERTLAGPEAYTEREVAERAGIDPDFLSRWNRAVGLAAGGPEERSYDEADVELAQRLNEYLAAGIPEDSVLTVGRTLGLGLGRVAEAIGALIGDALQQMDDIDPLMALRYASEVRSLGEVDARVVIARILSLQLVNWIRSQAVAIVAEEGELQGGQEVSVCFADLVGFTRLGEELSADQLSQVAELLVVETVEIVTPPVRLVKTIGDAVMLVCPDTDALIDASLELVAAVARRPEEMPALRAGIAYGTVIARAGDWYGPPVNLASRLTAAASPGTVVVTKAAREQSSSDTRQWSSAGSKRFKGVRESQKLYTVAR